MAMTRKDYELVAKALANQREAIVCLTATKMATLDESIETIAAHFALMNDLQRSPKFNKDAFMEAAHYGESSNT